MNFQIPDNASLPTGFKYPKEFLKIVELQITNLEPWVVMDRDQAITRLEGLKNRYPQRVLIPFARKIDNDDLACFELEKPGIVEIIHDFASPDYEQRQEYSSFWDWFKEAIDEMIDFE